MGPKQRESPWSRTLYSDCFVIGHQSQACMLEHVRKSHSDVIIQLYIYIYKICWGHRYIKQVLQILQGENLIVQQCSRTAEQS